MNSDMDFLAACKQEGGLSSVNRSGGRHSRVTRLYRYCSGCHGWQPFYRFFYRSASGSRHRWHRRCQACKQGSQPGAPMSGTPTPLPAGSEPAASAPASTPAGQSSPISSRPAEQL